MQLTPPLTTCAPASDPGCPLATPAACEALGLPFLDTDANTWPSGCLAQLEAKGMACASRLQPYSCAHEKYTRHANTTEECLLFGRMLNASYVGLAPAAEGNEGAFDCDAIFEFRGGCVWPGDWQYYELHTGARKSSCVRRPAVKPTIGERRPMAVPRARQAAGRRHEHSH